MNLTLQAMSLVVSWAVVLVMLVFLFLILRDRHHTLVLFEPNLPVLVSEIVAVAYAFLFLSLLLWR